MRHLAILFFMVFGVTLTMAQFTEMEFPVEGFMPVETGNGLKLGISIDAEEIGQERVSYNLVDEMPAYPGGFDAMQEFMRERIPYPATAKEDYVEGTVYVIFSLDESGFVNAVKLLRGVRPDLDMPCLRTIADFPRWKPAIYAGRTVPCKLVLQVRFVLREEN